MTKPRQPGTPNSHPQSRTFAVSLSLLALMGSLMATPSTLASPTITCVDETYTFDEMVACLRAEYCIADRDCEGPVCTEPENPECVNLQHYTRQVMDFIENSELPTICELQGGEAEPDPDCISIGILIALVEEILRDQEVPRLCEAEEDPSETGCIAPPGDICGENGCVPSIDPENEQTCVRLGTLHQCAGAVGGVNGPYSNHQSCGPTTAPLYCWSMWGYGHGSSSEMAGYVVAQLYDVAKTCNWDSPLGGQCNTDGNNWYRTQPVGGDCGYIQSTSVAWTEVSHTSVYPCN